MLKAKKYVKHICIILCILFFSCTKNPVSENLFSEALDFYSKNEFEKALNCINQIKKADSTFFQASLF